MEMRGDLQAVQRKRPARKFRFSFCQSVSRFSLACACLAERSDATCSRQAHAKLSRLQFFPKSTQTLRKQKKGGKNYHPLRLIFSCK